MSNAIKKIRKNTRLKTEKLTDVGAFIMAVIESSGMSEIDFRKRMRWQYKTLWHLKYLGREISVEQMDMLSYVSGIPVQTLLARYLLATSKGL